MQLVEILDNIGNSRAFLRGRSVITDAQGKRVLDTQSKGPFLSAKLPAGRYTVTAEQHQQTLTRTVHVATHKPTHVRFLWAV
jgi:hypothetical protein